MGRVGRGAPPWVPVLPLLPWRHRAVEKGGRGGLALGLGLVALAGALLLPLHKRLGVGPPPLQRGRRTPMALQYG